MLEHLIIAYIDDILIFFPPMRLEHAKHVVACLSDNQLYVKGEKCDFTTVFFLRYIINQEGITVDPPKVMAVTEWPTPKTVKELQRFLGIEIFL